MVEERIIGSILLDNECIVKIIRDLKQKHFENKICGMLYGICQELYSLKIKIDSVTICSKVKEEYKRAAFDKLRQCMIETTVSVEIKEYAEIVINNYKERKYISIIEKARKGTASEKSNEMIKELNELLSGNTYGTSTLSEVYEENKDKMYNKDYDPKRTYVGFYQLDQCIGGLEGGDICVIGARPSVGKSAFVSQVALNIARYHKKVVFYSLEMKKLQVYQRMLAYESGIEFGRIRNSKEFESIEEKNRYTNANKKLGTFPILINDDGGKTVDDIKNECLYIKNIGCIIIDYLQLIKPSKSYRGNRAAEVGDVSKSLKELAMSLDIPIILLSQLNRVSTGTKEPTMAELRESGDIEQDASVIILLWNASEEDKTLKGAKVDKSRNGITGRQMLEFYGATMTFKESNKPFPKATSTYAEKNEEDVKEGNPFE